MTERQDDARDAPDGSRAASTKKSRRRPAHLGKLGDKAQEAPKAARLEHPQALRETELIGKRHPVEKRPEKKG